jgi:chromosome segregation ATPase
VMREWRREQTMRAAPVAVQVPEPVAVANSQALAALWMQAQQLANESLQAAQAAWEVERSQLDTLRQELATAHDGLAAELDDVKARALAAEQGHEAALQQAAADLVDVRAALASALVRADRAEARTGELEREHMRLTGEASTLHAALENVRAELAATKAKADVDAQHHAGQRSQAAKAAHQLAERMTKAEAERDNARKAETQAREQAARLHGQVDALQQHNADLLRAVGAGGAKA